MPLLVARRLAGISPRTSRPSATGRPPCARSGSFATMRRPAGRPGDRAFEFLVAHGCGRGCRSARRPASDLGSMDLDHDRILRGSVGVADTPTAGLIEHQI